MQVINIRTLLAFVVLAGMTTTIFAQGIRPPAEFGAPASTLRAAGGASTEATAPATRRASTSDAGTTATRVSAGASSAGTSAVGSPAAASRGGAGASAAATASAGRQVAQASGAATRQQAPGSRQSAAPANATPVNNVGAGSGVTQAGDSIVAVVNNDVITRRELQARVQNTLEGLSEQNIPAPPPDVLDRQVLERMVTEKALLQEADRAGIRVSDDQLDMAIMRIAEQNNLSLDAMRKEIETEVSWQRYREELREQIRINRLREMEVDRNIIISEAEIDAFLAEQANQTTAPGNPGAALHLAQILVRVPEGSSPSEIASLRARAENLRQQVAGGTDFAQVAAAASDGEEALRGGDLGIRPAAGWPDLFLQAVGQLKSGQVSQVVQSGNGFHILKVVSREGGAAPMQLGADGQPMPVTQHRVRHILLETSAVLNDEQARARLQAMRDRIVSGQVSFADMARQYSNDASAPQGGELGWVSPGETVPQFEEALVALEPGQVSAPVRTPFGWHLLLVEERRVQDVSEENRRMQARQFLFQRKLEPAWMEWSSLVRSRAYVDNRLERDLQ